MRSKQPRMWICAAKQEEDPDPGNWEKVVTIIQAAFKGGELATLCAWKMVVVIPMGVGTNFRGIGLVEVLWKVIPVFINFWISSSIQFHDAIYEFRAGRGTGTSTLKDNLLQQLITMREKFLHYIFLNLQKPYDALYRGLCLDILEGCGVGSMTLRILRTYRARLQMAAKAVGHY